MNKNKAAMFFATTIVLLVFANFPVAALEVKSTKGQSMDIEVLGYTKSSGNVRIKRNSDGAIFNTKLEVFDNESQEKIIAAAPKAKAKLDTKVTVGRRRKNVPGSSYMETQTLTTKINIENDSRDVDFTKGKGTLFLVTRDTKRYANRNVDHGKILLKESFEVNLNPGQTLSYECKPAITKYDSDRDSSNVGGQEYYGWMLILQEGDIVHSVETSIGNLKKDVDENPHLGEVYLKLNVNQTVKSNLEKLK